MHTHIKKAYNFLENHLPFKYTEETRELLLSSGIEVSSCVIRNVRAKKSPNNIAVLNALLKVATKHKEQNELLQEELEPIN